MSATADCSILAETVPRSRHNSQYNQEELSAALEKSHLGYLYMPGLGGFRHPEKDSSANLGWSNLSFRGYADYMQTAAFETSLLDLITVARNQQVAIMCAEAVPWRCHRSLIADALLVRDIEVLEIVSATKTKPLILHPWALVQGTKICYPASVVDPSRSGDGSGVPPPEEKLH